MAFGLADWCGFPQDSGGQQPDLLGGARQMAWAGELLREFMI